METKIFFLASSLGTLAFALSGYMQAVRKELDIMGLFIVAFLTANGGGALRDVLIGKVPVILHDTLAFYMVTSTCLAAYILKLHKYDKLDRQLLFVISDSVGLVAFSITGAFIAIEQGLNNFGVMVLSIITALGGGIIRDIALNEVPAILNREFYGSVSLFVAMLIIIANSLDSLNNYTVAVVFFAGMIFKMLSYKYNWKLPKVLKG